MKHKCEWMEDDMEIINDGDEDPEEYGWSLHIDDCKFGKFINYCPICGIELTRNDWNDLK